MQEVLPKYVVFREHYKIQWPHFLSNVILDG